MRAATVSELQRQVADLPLDDRPVRPDVSAPMSVGPPGIRPFIHQLVAPAELARVRRLTLDTLAQPLGRIGFELLEQPGTGLVFERVSRRGWFSVSRERVVFSFEEHGSAQTRIMIYGRATRAVRKRFAALSF
jgi:hypothetical protein